MKNQWKRAVRAAAIGVAALVVFGGFGACGPTKGGPAKLSPEWLSTTVTFFHVQVPASGDATGWVTTVQVPGCVGRNGTDTHVSVVASTGSLTYFGGGTYTWTREVTGAPPVARVPGVITADCTDGDLHAHPVLAVPSN